MDRGNQPYSNSSSRKGRLGLPNDSTKKAKKPTVRPAPTPLSPRHPRRKLGPGKSDTQEPSCDRCYLPVLAGLAGRSLLGVPTVGAANEDAGRTELSLGTGIDPTGAGCGLQGTASSPSCTVERLLYHGRPPLPPTKRGVRPKAKRRASMKASLEGKSAWGVIQTRTRRAFRAGKTGD